MSAATSRTEANFLQGLLRHGLFIETGVDGVYGRSGVFEDAMDRFGAVLTAFGRDDGAEVFRFPPAMTRPQFERSGYMKSFPQLAGTIHSFMGNDRDHLHLLDDLECGRDWTHHQRATDVVLTPAACYPLYPAIGKRGPLPAEGGLFDVFSYCFRHEPSLDPARMQFFRMREYVRIGTSDQVVAFRQLWLDRCEALMKSLGVPVTIDVATDPFFGRAGKLLSNNQRDQKLKFELLAPITSEEQLTACISFNYHQDHFGTMWNLVCNNEVAHTACIGFGMDRMTLALFRHHGFDPREWPRTVRRILWGE
ncbi:MAG: amino acid--[acyl-carrier-protein] ligase [Steroidobacteraceae bacterium]